VDNLYVNQDILSNGSVSATTYYGDGSNLTGINVGVEFTGNTSGNPINQLWVDNNVHANSYYGDGSNLTGIIAGAGAIPITYNNLVNNITASTLTAGTNYIITDFQTCYDQPDFNSFGSSITNNNYKQAAIEPIVVFATSANTISSTAYQPKYPNDRIQYDWTFNSTERTQGVAYGRISERIDEFNNRTDYDHRTIQFRRYQYIEINFDSPYQGTVSVSPNSGTEMNVNGTGTVFTGLTQGQYVGFNNGDQDFRVYEITSISGNTLMVITGLTNVNIGDVQMFPANSQSDTSYRQNNITTAYTEYYTFDYNNFVANNNIGNYANSYAYDENSFILANNVFQGDYRNNIFGDMCFNNSFNDDCENNTIGNYFYNNITDDDFDGNVIGNYFRDNRITSTFRYNRIGENFQSNYIVQNDFYRNNIMNDFRENIISGNDFQNNEIGSQFNNNVIRYGQFYKNDIGNGYNLNEVYSDFFGNLIGNGYNNNNVYSEFYDNQVGENFNSNTIGDNGNLDNFNFYGNRIGNNFNDNTIRQDFRDNQIGNEFNNNIVNGDFRSNVIGYDFYDNYNIGHNFYGNHIGELFNNNELIGDNFQDNQIGENFNNNIISYDFNDNQIGKAFENNTLGDTQYFNWDNTDIENLTARTYNNFYDSLFGNNGENIGNVILGKELIMHFYRDSGTTVTGGYLVTGETYQITTYQADDDFSNVADVISGVINTNDCIFIATGTSPSVWSGSTTLTELTVYDEYHKVKFTQWTQNNNGGGFSYERTKVYPSVESTVYFTKLNYSNLVDIVVPSRLEIKRGNNQAIYNDAVENNWNENVSPEGTEWNSIYTQSNNGSNFQDNTIFNGFKGNYIRNDFQNNDIESNVGGNQFSGDTYQNKIGPYTFDNDFLGSMSNNSWVSDFNNNTFGYYFNNNKFNSSISSNMVGNDFFSNQIENYFQDNTIGIYFQNNEIGSFFSNNTIDDNFGFGYADPQGNKIGNNFYDNTVGEYFYNNSIPDNFRYNTIGPYFQWNVINTKIDYTDFTVNYGNITGFSYTATGTSATNNTYIGIQTCGTTQSMGVGASFAVEVSEGSVIGVSGNTQGRLYANGDVLTILGIQIGGTTPEDNVVITVTGVTSASLFYEHQTKQIFERKGGNKRVSYYDEEDVLNIDSIYEASGYIPVYSQSLTFPITYASFDFWCDGGYTNAGATTNQTVNNVQELVTLFNSNFRSFGYFFDGNDGTLGLYINPSLKQQYCPNGTYTIFVFED
jgi:hypothetical protein